MGSISGMKVSVSLPDDDVAFLDEVVRQELAPTRSAALHQAVALLRHASLERSYAAAWAEWRDEDGDATWSATDQDGLDAPG